MNENNKPRLCEVLGVDVDEEFLIRDDVVRINAAGYLCEGGRSSPYKDTASLCSAINDPELVRKVPHLGEHELAICHVVGALWASQDEGSLGSSWVTLWAMRPRKVISEEGNINYEPLLSDPEHYVVVMVDPSLFPSLKPGDLAQA